MVNQLGLLRMKNYQILTMVPLNKEDYDNLNIFINISSSQKHLTLLKRYDLINEFNQLENDWNTRLITKIQQAQKIDEIKIDIENYVARINHLVDKIDQKTENKIYHISQLQQLFIVIIVIFLAVQIYYLRYYLLAPWQKLISMAEAISNHNFKARFNIKGRKNEFDLLGLAFNKMSEQIESQYLLLEKQVAEKTAKLQQTNKIVSFQYQTIKQLHTSEPLCERFLKILHKLEDLVPLTQFKIRFYESNDPEHYQQISYDNEQKLPYCQ
ncbi:HAMP domain-containing protein [Gilliamella sp. GillExp13]|uniref:HAMP domain-containing protein n=1 Tax=Gilliamella sp. GillExp13 TaxID=3120243 RepID=UPI00080ED3DF|nr:HAMP domain-containing protein [Gilliamella apicola]OCG64009.1 hypothetical protein A9G37_08040 [Gilliamella apicola]